MSRTRGGWYPGTASRMGDMREYPRMSSISDRVRRYGFALLTFAIGLAATSIPVIRDGSGTPLIVTFFDILVSAWYGGLGPGLMITALIALLTSGTSYPSWRVVRLALF